MQKYYAHDNVRLTIKIFKFRLTAYTKKRTLNIKNLSQHRPAYNTQKARLY